MVERFYKKEVGIESPGVDSFTITPNDSTEFANTITRGLYVGVTGNVKVMMESYNNANNVQLFVNVQGGTIPNKPISTFRGSCCEQQSDILARKNRPSISH